MGKQGAEIAVTFKNRNVLFFRIQPQVGIVWKHVTFGESDLQDGRKEYEKLILACAMGDSTLFVSAEEHMTAWQLLSPVLAHWETTSPEDFPNYSAGALGPIAADCLLEPEHQWETLFHE